MYNNNQETTKERIAIYRALKYQQQHEYEEVPSDPASDGIGEDDTLNEEWSRFWFGD